MNCHTAARHGLGRFGVRAAAALVVPLVFRGRGHGVLVAVDRLLDGPAFNSRGRAAAGGVRGERGDRDRDGGVGRG
jgi:hypothetical protein